MGKLGAVLVLAAAIALAGCSSGAGGTTAAEPAASAVSTPEAAPITMTPESAAPTAPQPTATDADFIAAASYSWKGALPTDAQFLAARDLACEQLKAGTPYDDVSVVEGSGEDAVSNNEHLVKAAVTLLCPEFDD